MKMMKMLIVFLLISIVVLQLMILISKTTSSKLIRVCPTNAIYMKFSKAYIDVTKCIGCQRCVIGILAPINNTINNNYYLHKDSSSIVSKVSSYNTFKDTITTSKKSYIKSTTVKKKSLKKAHRVNSEKCIGCALCIPNCPVQAITMYNGKAVIDLERCINCGICINGNNVDYQGCPVSAIIAP